MNDLGTYNGFTYEPPKESIFVRATRKMSKAYQEAESERRAADAAGMPAVIADIQERQRAEQEKFDRVQAAIEGAQASLTGQVMPEREQPQLGNADWATQGIGAALTGGRSLNQGYDQLMGQRQVESDQKYQRAIQAFGLQREDTQTQLAHLHRLALSAEGNIADMAKEALSVKWAAERDAMAQERDRLNKAQDFARNKELLGMKGEQGETSAAYKAYYNAPDLTVRRKAWEFLANRGEFLPEPTEQTGKEVLTGAQIADTQSKTRERETLLPEKVAKVQAEVQRILGGVQLDDARKQQILQRVQYYPLEFQNRAANILSQIEGRKNKALNPKEKAVNLSDLERLRKIVQDRIDLAGPLGQDPKDLAEMYRLNQMREEILNAKVYGDVGTVAPYNPLSGEIQAKNPGTGFIYNGAGFDRPPKDKPSKTPRKKVSTAEARKRFNY